MRYERMWKELKEKVEDILEEGKECAFDIEGGDNYEAFFAYKYINKYMERLEKNTK